MQRRWQVHPDETGVVSREALIGAFIDAAALLDIAGGCLSVVTGRAPTALDGEMVMTGAIFEWRDRTDARPQPEMPQNVTAGVRLTDEAREAVIREAATPEAGAAEVARVEGEATAAPSYTDPEVAALAEYRGEPSGENPDGFDYERLEAEDVEEPEPVR